MISNRTPMLSTSAREGADSLTISEKKEKSTKPPTEKSVRKGRTRHCLKSKYGSACVVCKEDHKACDGNRPCSRCVALGIAGSCKSSARRKYEREDPPSAGNLVFCIEQIERPSGPTPNGHGTGNGTRQTQPRRPNLPHNTTTTTKMATNPQHRFHTSIFTPLCNNSSRSLQTSTFDGHKPRSPVFLRNSLEPTEIEEMVTVRVEEEELPSPPTTEDVLLQFTPPTITHCAVVRMGDCEEQLWNDQLSLLQKQLEKEREKQSKLRMKLRMRRVELEHEQMRRVSLEAQHQRLLKNSSSPASSSPMLSPLSQPHSPQPLQHFKEEEEAEEEEEEEQNCAIQLLRPLQQLSSPGKRKRKLEDLLSVDRYVVSRKQKEEKKINLFEDMTEREMKQNGWGWDSFPVPLDHALDYKRFSQSWYAPFIIKDPTKPWSILRPHTTEDGTHTAACLAVNEATCRLHGLCEDEILGVNRHKVYADDKESREINQRSFVGNSRRVVKPGVSCSPIFTAQLRFKSTSGEIYDAVATKQFFYNATGHVSFFVLLVESTALVSHDVTPSIEEMM